MLKGRFRQQLERSIFLQNRVISIIINLAEKAGFGCVRAAATCGFGAVGPRLGLRRAAVVVARFETEPIAPSAWHQWFMDDAAATTAPFMKHDRIHAEFLI
jgi:hypothetical protein